MPTKSQVRNYKKRSNAAEGVWSRVELSGIIAIFFLILTFIFVYPELDASTRYDLGVGDISTEHITAPRDLSYVSEIETEAALQQALASIEDIYDSPDPQVGREQVRTANEIMTYARVVRADSYADDALKTGYLTAITPITLTEETKVGILAINDESFSLLEEEVVNLIEEVMSGTVREGQVDDEISQLELKVNPELPETLIPLSVSIASDLIEPNSALNEIATHAAREEVIENVPEITREIKEDEVIVRAGEAVTNLDLEAMEMLGLTDSQFHFSSLFTSLLASLVITGVLTLYMLRIHEPRLDTTPKALPIILLILIFIVTGEILLQNEPSLIFVFPVGALALTLAALYGIQMATIVTLLIAITFGLLLDNMLEITVFMTLTGVMGAASLRRQGRLNAYFIAGLTASLAGIIIRLIFQLVPDMAPAELLNLTVFPLLNGLLSAGLALVILLLIGNITGIATPLKLLDLMRTDHPLQKRLQNEALGTYQHTLTIANLAESAAEAIGADKMLTRVGTLYHDIGKMSNPGFFIENRLESGRNPHDGLSPQASARIILTHVDEGVKMARRHRLPQSVINFITEHHGTMPTLYFLNKAREEAEDGNYDLDESIYFYKGPRPQSRETAIVMICDACESAVRAAVPGNKEEIEEVVTKIIQQRMDYQQLDDSGLTLRDIKTVQEALIRTLVGMYHPRIKYPEPRKLESDETPNLPEGGEGPAAGRGS